MTTTVHTDAIGLTALILVAVAWVGFGIIIVLRIRRAEVEEAKRAPAAIWGIALQGVAIALVWTFHRPQWWPFADSMAGELVLAAVAVVLAWASGWWILRSIQTLGKQWTLRARVIEGHQLITQGPYAIVRNPIYLGMFGLLLATGLVLSEWWALLGGILVFCPGTWIRIRAEESLLREMFGPQFADYAQRVKAFLPRIF